MKRLAALLMIAVLVSGLAACTGCDPNPSDCPPNPQDCANPEEPNSCDSSPYGMTPTVPTF